MNQEKFYPERFFELENFVHKEVFVLDQPAWETIKIIKQYINNWFLSGELKSDFQKTIGSYYEGKNISIGKGTRIYPGAYIGDNVIIGENCEIRPGAFLRGNLIIGDNVVIGNSTEAKNAILLNNSNAPHLNYIGDSIVGNDCNLGAGTILSNIRFDYFTTDRTILVRNGDEKIDSSLRKLGAIFGDRAQTGCQAVLSPGTIVGKGAILGGSRIHLGIIEQESKLY
jgi:NDP-sugar pyrophosphorylase family protein